MHHGILVLNAGSSSIRFALYQLTDSLQLQLQGKLDRIGHVDTHLTIAYADNQAQSKSAVDAADYHAAIHWLLDWFAEKTETATLTAVGHRVVHGMRYNQPQRITPALLEQLRELKSFDPEHLPNEIALIEVLQQRYPHCLHVACFDTAFHRDMPRVAKLLPIPYRYQAEGIERYGFHGLSYQYLMAELVRLGDATATQGRVILAHLGSGASMAAVCNGKSVDTSMGFTPASGLMMATRTGDLDPGLMYYLTHAQHLRSVQLQHLVNHESGLLGVSGSSADARDLLARMDGDERAADAIKLFCYQAKKWLGSFATVLGGLDTLVFSGGIGENAAVIRAQICAGLEFLGIEIHEQRNANHAAVISSDTSRVTVRVIHTDEELIIARSVGDLIAGNAKLRGRS